MICVPRLSWLHERHRSHESPRQSQLPSIFKTMYSNIDRSEKVRRPPVFNWYLAKLHLELGLSDSSRRYAEKYLDWLPDNRHSGRERDWSCTSSGNCLMGRLESPKCVNSTGVISPLHSSTGPSPVPGSKRLMAWLQQQRGFGEGCFAGYYV